MKQSISSKTLEVKESIEIYSPIEDVWALINNFHSFWMDGVDVKMIDRETREMETPTGGRVVERLIEISEKNQQVQYEILSGSLPVKNYISTLKVSPGGDRSSVWVTWKARFEAGGVSEVESMEIIASLYRVGLASLKEKLDQENIDFPNLS